VTSILDQEEAPAKELAALYHERWEIETALDELKTHEPLAKLSEVVEIKQNGLILFG
jgi:IS4 transposase